MAPNPAPTSKHAFFIRFFFCNFHIVIIILRVHRCCFVFFSERSICVIINMSRFQHFNISICVASKREYQHRFIVDDNNRSYIIENTWKISSTLVRLVFFNFAGCWLLFRVMIRNSFSRKLVERSLVHNCAKMNRDDDKKIMLLDFFFNNFRGTVLFFMQLRYFVCTLEL